ncbi:hypothetical protein SAMN05661086_01677 [Anaeromicropila populeti]|uniref:Uncharacterized protein n=2 Tax=Anaeromicropila populeti TaxID=37658 RepID=A0A1I6JGV9_9FIRM|nr:hypothetical protein SAMN05661086_01677 [Anaeromicropila populeti]
MLLKHQEKVDNVFNTRYNVLKEHYEVIHLQLNDKQIYLEKASLIWDELTERQKGRLEGQLEVYENLIEEKKKDNGFNNR